MIKLKDMTLKNFLSIGNSAQSIKFDNGDLTLVLGENLDLGGDGSRNGTGKSTIESSLTYALFGYAVSDIKKDNLVNKSNGKNMLVTLNFESDGINYTIHRGRKPSILKFFVNNVEQIYNDMGQGDSRETQAEIERVLGLTYEMFLQIVTISTYTVPFLQQKIHEQRVIIEQLLGITLLSEKAEKLKEDVKNIKEAINNESIRIKSTDAANKRIQEQINNLIQKKQNWETKKKKDLESLTLRITALKNVDITQEIINHGLWAKYKEYLISNDKRERYLLEIFNQKTNITNLENDIELLINNKCPECYQNVHDDRHREMLINKKELLVQAGIKLLETELKVIDITTVSRPKDLIYSDLNEAHRHKNKIELLQQEIDQIENQIDPYTEQINDMEQRAIEQLDYTLINELTKYNEHQEFLLKLLTNKDSFVRKRIIEQNLSYLNTRLSHYLNLMGLPHEVTFQNDLGVTITELGRDLDSGNLSRGEMTRLSLSLSWSFRDVWEQLYQKINLLFIDENLDNGLDQIGVENAMKVLKSMNREINRDVWLISHREELISGVSSVFRVFKENGFTTFSNEDS